MARKREKSRKISRVEKLEAELRKLKAEMRKAEARAKKAETRAKRAEKLAEKARKRPKPPAKPLLPPRPPKPPKPPKPSPKMPIERRKKISRGVRKYLAGVRSVARRERISFEEARGRIRKTVAVMDTAFKAERAKRDQYGYDPATGTFFHKKTGEEISGGAMRRAQKSARFWAGIRMISNFTGWSWKKTLATYRDMKKKGKIKKWEDLAGKEKMYEKDSPKRARGRK